MVAKSTLQTTFDIPSSLNSQQRELLANKIVTEIRNRTKSGISPTGKPFKAYTKSYKESMDFEIAGKSSTVNLSQTGDTLADLQVILNTTGKIVVGYPTDYEDTEKIEGLVLGASGKAGVVGNPSRARPFIGLPQSTLKLLIEEVISETFDAQLEEERTRTSYINGILGRLGIGN